MNGIPVKKLRENAMLPTYGSAEAAGADLYACLSEPVVIEPGQSSFIPTGIAMEIPRGYAGLIYARSGLACKRGLAPANKVGVVDSDYRGEFMVVLHNHGVQPQTVCHGERIEQVSGNLTDHFDPRTNVIRLSDNVYSSTSTAAIGVACHEAGHAVQYAKHYAPIKLRAAIIPITNIGSKLAMPLILLGLVLSYAGSISYTFVYLGIACFSLSVVFQLITLPVEFNASRRAMRTIDEAGILTQDEQIGARKTLTAAAMTYVAAMAVAFAQLLRLIILFGGRRRRD